MRTVRLEKRVRDLSIAVEVTVEPSEDIVALIKKLREALVDWQ